MSPARKREAVGNYDYEIYDNQQTFRVTDVLTGAAGDEATHTNVQSQDWQTLYTWQKPISEGYEHATDGTQTRREFEKGTHTQELTLSGSEQSARIDRTVESIESEVQAWAAEASLEDDEIIGVVTAEFEAHGWALYTDSNTKSKQEKYHYDSAHRLTPDGLATGGSYNARDERHAQSSSTLETESESEAWNYGSGFHLWGNNEGYDYARTRSSTFSSSDSLVTESGTYDDVWLADGLVVRLSTGHANGQSAVTSGTVSHSHSYSDTDPIQYHQFDVPGYGTSADHEILTLEVNSLLVNTTEEEFTLDYNPKAETRTNASQRTNSQDTKTYENKSQQTIDPTYGDGPKMEGERTIVNHLDKRFPFEGTPSGWEYETETVDDSNVDANPSLGDIWFGAPGHSETTLIAPHDPLAEEEELDERAPTGSKLPGGPGGRLKIEAPPNVGEVSPIRAFFGELLYQGADLAASETPYVGQAKAARELATGTDIRGDELGVIGHVGAALDMIPGGGVAKKSAEGLAAAGKGVGKAAGYAYDGVRGLLGFGGQADAAISAAQQGLKQLDNRAVGHAIDAARLNSGAGNVPKSMDAGATKAAGGPDGGALVPKGAKPLGDWGEARLRDFLGAPHDAPRPRFSTSQGIREIDVLKDGIAHESKAGVNVKLNQTIVNQILKDKELILEGDVKGAHWHFWQGASQDVLDFLTENGIPYTVHSHAI